MENNELVLDRGKLLAEVAILSPAEEAELLAKLDAALTENVSLKEKLDCVESENADLKQQLAWFKKQVYGQKSEKTYPPNNPASDQQSTAALFGRRRAYMYGSINPRQNWLPGGKEQFKIPFHIQPVRSSGNGE